ncbi:SCO1 protein [archaeon HR06]|nr:SCO1 protein [archaeon HR06]
MRKVYFLGIGVFLLALAIFFSIPKEEYKPSIELPERPLPDFKLINQNGEEFTLSSQRGKVILLFFGYTHCPDVCPVVASKYAYIANKVDSSKVALIFVTTDPYRDNPKTLKNWLSKFSDKIIGLTGKEEDLEKVWDLFQFKNLYTDIKGNPIDPKDIKDGKVKDYYVTHFAYIIVADKNMKTRFAFTPEMGEDEWLQGVLFLLKQ